MIWICFKKQIYIFVFSLWFIMYPYINFSPQGFISDRMGFVLNKGEGIKRLWYLFLRNIQLLWSGCYFWRGYAERWALSPTGIKIFFIFPGFLNSDFFSWLSIRETTGIQSLLYKKPSLALLVVNQTSTKMFQCFIISFPQLYVIFAVGLLCFINIWHSFI